MYIGEEW